MSETSVAATVKLRLEPSLNVPSDPLEVDHIGAALDVKLNCLLTAGFDPSDAVSVNVYVVLEATSGKVPEIRPVAVFKVTPEGKEDPAATAYVIVESSEAVADTDIATASPKDPKEPAEVVHDN